MSDAAPAVPTTPPTLPPTLPPTVPPTVPAAGPAAWLRDTIDRWAESPALDGGVDVMAPVVGALVPAGALRDGLHGQWLGHPLHPMLTDLPIGFWTSAFVLDLVGGRGARVAARRLVAFGVASVPLTALSGAADWAEADAETKRIGVLHALGNLVATGLYAVSWRQRRNGRQLAGVLTGLAAASAATVAGHLGGYLAFRRGVATVARER